MPGQGISVVTPDNGLNVPGLDAAAALAMTGELPQDPEALKKQAEDDPMSDKKLVEAFLEFKDEAYDQRWIFEREWWRNLLYYVSRQWIYYDTKRNSWLDKRMARWVPRPVTNKIQETCDGMLSVAQGVQLGVVCRPEGADPIDLMTAENATKLAPALHVEHQIDNVQQAVDFYSIITGNAFLQLWWDRSGEKGKIVVPLEKCVECGNTHLPTKIVEAGNCCPDCKCPSMMAAVDPATGKPMIERFARGRGRTDALSPFEVAFKLSFTNFAEIDGLIRSRWRTKAWCKKNLPKTVFEQIKTWERMTSDRSLQLLRGIQTQSDLATPSFGEGGGGQIGGEGITEYDWWMKPNAEYPEGLVCRFLGESNPIVLRLEDEALPGPLPYKTPQGDPFFPFIHLPFKKLAGRIWGISPLNVLIQKQDQLNQLDSMIQMMVLRTSNPVWMKPKGSNATKITGETGIVIEYTPIMSAGNIKPERIAGEQVPASLFRIREGLIADIENLAGTFDIIKGQKPTGVEAFSALQLLVERSQSRFGPWLAQRGEAYREWFSMALELERQFGPDERTWAVLGPNNRWTFEEFRQADLQGAIRIVVEDGSQTPKTSLGKRAAIQQLSQLGVINAANPDTAYRILQAFGETDLWPGLDAAVQSALREQYQFEKWAETVEILQVPQPAVDPMTGMPSVQHVPQFTTPPPGQRMAWDNDGIHIEEHKKWANSDTVRRLIDAKPWLSQYVAWMIQQHEQAQIWAQTMGLAAPAGGAQGTQTPDNQAMRASNRESGNPADVPRGQSEANQGRGPE